MVASVSPVPTAQYRPAIDGLRAVAVLAVFIFHLNHRWLPGGFVGVDVFFVISGYLITSILLREYEHNSFRLGKFCQRRIARLFPAFFAVAFTTLAGATFLYSAQDLASCGASLTAAALSVANIKYLLQGSYFAISPDAQPFVHYWSLSVEEQFYMLFPITLLLLYLKTNKYKTVILAFLCGASLLGCIALTHTKPTWAFFLLPTRAWELLAGSIVANVSAHRPRPDTAGTKFWASLSLAGLALIAISLFVIREGSRFPGYLAILPVLGTVGVLGLGKGSSGLSEWLLSRRPMALIGRMSYSLYLWHWPVFSLVDYRLYLASPPVRTGLKLALSLAATALSFFLIEKPGRVFLNHPRNRPIAFAFLGCALLFSVPLGIGVRKANYVNAEMRDIRGGGLVFNEAGKNGSMVLMGDSNGSVYGKVATIGAYERGLKLNVISVAAGDPLPHSAGPQPPLWVDSLAVVKRERPDFLLLVCAWQDKLKDDKGRLGTGIRELKKYARHIILITQPPELPELANREAMRNGSRPPFREDSAERAARLESNALVKGLQGGNVRVIDIGPLFTTDDGGILFADKDGNQVYQDSGHLSASGAGLVKASLLNLMANAPRVASTAPDEHPDRQ